MYRTLSGSPLVSGQVGSLLRTHEIGRAVNQEVSLGPIGQSPSQWPRLDLSERAQSDHGHGESNFSTGLQDRQDHETNQSVEKTNNTTNKHKHMNSGCFFPESIAKGSSGKSFEH